MTPPFLHLKRRFRRSRLEEPLGNSHARKGVERTVKGKTGLKGRHKKLSPPAPSRRPFLIIEILLKDSPIQDRLTFPAAMNLEYQGLTKKAQAPYFANEERCDRRRSS